ncbi:MAG: sulfatase-like hydrolase/transferase [Phycisphaerae bacterium]|jgi:arylsulfatase A-like enzyme|nr:sulfatase-like hydrolase/transferase [Phycisphaerae bacterium]
MKQHNRREFLKTVALGAAAVSLGGCKQAISTTASGKAGKKPNIILIMVDDMGWMDLHCQGNKNLDTPHIDKLAKDGMRFTDAYAAAPVCSPTRASIMSGQSPARLMITNHIPDHPRFEPKGAKLKSAKTINVLPLEKVTIAERLKSAGYATAFMGKWHMSGKRKGNDQGRGDDRFNPENQGFDINIGGCCYGGPPTYWDPYKIYNLKPRKAGEYLPDRLCDEAMSFITASRAKKQPFFLSLWNYTVHWPMEAPNPLIEKYKSRIGPGIKDARYAAMLEAMDTAMGRLFAKVDELGIRDETLVIFTSDNGAYGGVGDNRPLRLDKGHLYEGGIRVPTIIRWPGIVPPNTTCATPIISTDFYPTLLSAAGLQPQRGQIIDGEDITPLLTQKGPLTRKAIHFHYPNYAFHRSNGLGGAIRQGKYKLIKWYLDGSVELYDLSKDISEKVNIAKQHPKIAAQMKADLETWLVKNNAIMPERIT